MYRFSVPGASILGGWRIATPKIMGRGLWGRVRVVKYYYILSCTGSMFQSGDFRREIE